MSQSRSALALDLAIALISIVAFSALAVAVAHGATHDFDLAIRESIHACASVPLTAVMKFVTNFGGGWWLWPAGIVIAGLLLREGRRREGVLFAIAVVGAELVNEIMKLIFHRPRPEAYFGYPSPVTYSFPSGHSLVSYCFYLALAEVLVRPEWTQLRAAALWCGAGLLILWIGLSRIYLGVHYPTDVIGGYTAAVAWTAVLRAVHQGPPRP